MPKQQQLLQVFWCCHDGGLPIGRRNVEAGSEVKSVLRGKSLPALTEHASMPSLHCVAFFVIVVYGFDYKNRPDHVNHINRTNLFR